MDKAKARSERFVPVSVSSETEALRRFFPEGRGRLNVKIMKGFFGADSPEVKEDGRMASRWIMGGLFCIFTWDEWTFSGDKRVNPIHGHCIIGWDSRDKEYRMLRAANMGVLHQLNGSLRGNRLAFVSDETMIKGKPTRIKYTMIRKRAKRLLWIAEFSVRGGPWKKISESNLHYS
jgi:hypothetical protein